MVADKRYDIIIRTDAAKAIGAGHVMRCLAFAQRLSDSGMSVLFVSAKNIAFCQQRLTQEGFSYCALDCAVGSVKDAKATLALAQQFQARAIVFDSYHF